MIELVWSPRSLADLEEIHSYIEADSPAWADLTVRRLVASVEWSSTERIAAGGASGWRRGAAGPPHALKTSINTATANA